MRRTIAILFAVIMVAVVGSQAYAQSSHDTYLKAKQKAKERIRQELSRYENIIDSRDLQKYKQFIADYPYSKRTPEIKNRVAELELWSNANARHTIDAYQSYLDKTKYHWYDSQANRAINTIKQAAEKQAWDKVVAENTIPAYKQYLADNPQSGYRNEAESAIKRIECAEEWQRIKDSDDIDQLENFVNRYPNTNEVANATNRLHCLKGLQYYYQNNLSSAYREFSQINRSDLPNDKRKAYDDVMEYDEYSSLSASSSQTALLSFLEKYPNGNYSANVSNMVALSKARNLNEYSTESDYSSALSYAKNYATESSVRNYIAQSKKAQKESIKRWNRWKRQDNGGTVNIGLNFLDAGYGFNNEAWYYNAGLFLRLGNFKDRVQFAIGVQPGVVIGYEGWYSEDEYTEFHMPIVGQLKLNLFKMSENSRFFLYGQYQYNAIRIEDIETEMGWSAGFGFAWKHFDWSFYYRQDIGHLEDYYYDDDRSWSFGMSMIYYWKL